MTEPKYVYLVYDGNIESLEKIFTKESLAIAYAKEVSLGFTQGDYTIDEWELTE